MTLSSRVLFIFFQWEYDKGFGTMDSGFTTNSFHSSKSSSHFLQPWIAILQHLKVDPAKFLNPDAVVRPKRFGVSRKYDEDDIIRKLYIQPSSFTLLRQTGGSPCTHRKASHRHQHQNAGVKLVSELNILLQRSSPWAKPCQCWD